MDEPLTTPGEPGRERDLTGLKLGDYELIRRLGRGGMADVYLARQASLGRQVAVKVLKQQYAADEKYVRRFQQEARAAASLVHANIVQIHEVGCLQGIHFIAQEYVHGQNLKQHIHRHGPVDARLAVRIIRQVAAALHRSAQQSIIHRDIKPENIMLATTGEVKVADFGLARIGQNGARLDLTQIGETMGTPLYMSPEQIEGREVDPRSDIYSLGVTCFHMLTGQPPFGGESLLNVAIQHLNQPPPRLEALRPDLPAGMCRVVHKMLNKQPDDRYQSATELLKDLRALKIEGEDGDWTSVLDEWSDTELSALADTPSSATLRLATVMATRALAIRRRRRQAWVAVAMMAVAFGGGAAWAWVRRPVPLLEVPADQRPEVKQLNSVRAQYIYASLEGSEAALQSVERYFRPEGSAENRLYVRRSWQRLGDLYLAGDELAKAMDVYTRLAETVEDTEQSFRAVGLAGQAIVHSRRGQKEQAAAKLAEALPLLEGLNPAEVQSLLDQLDPELRRELERLRRERRP